MGLWKKFFGNSKKNSKGELLVNNRLENNLNLIKEILQDSTDIVYRAVEVGETGHKAAIIFVDGMADKKLINEFVLTHLMVFTRTTHSERGLSSQELIKLITDKVLSVSEMKEIDTIDEAIDNILSGETVLLLDGYEKIIIIGSKGWSMRGVSEPTTEVVVRGPRDGFTETFRVNTALVRRRIRDPRLKVTAHKTGVRSKTDIGLMYIEDIADEKLVEEVNSRLEKIDIDAILESNYIEELIEDNWLSIFPQIQNTERPDVVAAALYEGKVAILVDNTPFALILPTTYNSLMQSAEDYYERWPIATAVRLLRYLAAIISLTAPALYVAITSFHPQMIPTPLALKMAALRTGVPFPSIVEALLMETTIELLREAGIRLPGPIGATIGIVGGLVIGQAAVEAGLVGPLMVIVVAITAISSFAIPSYNLAIGFRLFRFAFIFAAGFLGLYGVTLMAMILLIHLSSLKSFGTPYLSPFVTIFHDSEDLKDTIYRGHWASMNNRGITARKQQKNRLDDKKQENLGKGVE